MLLLFKQISFEVGESRSWDLGVGKVKGGGVGGGGSRKDFIIFSFKLQGGTDPA